MRKKSLILLGAGALLAALGIALYLFSRPPAVEPPPPPPDAPPETPSLPDERNAALNLYFGTPYALRDVDRLELTVVRIEMIGRNGVEYPVDASTTKLMVSQGAAQKVASAAIFHGGAGRLRLTFGPTARIFRSGGGQDIAYLPNARVEAVLNADVGLSRTLAVFVPLPPNVSIGDREGRPTLVLPETASAETYVLGGFLLNPRDAGQILDPETMDIYGVVKDDLGFDIRPREGERGTPGFSPAPEGQPL